MLFSKYTSRNIRGRDPRHAEFCRTPAEFPRRNFRPPEIPGPPRKSRISGPPGTPPENPHFRAPGPPGVPPTSVGACPGRGPKKGLFGGVLPGREAKNRVFGGVPKRGFWGGSGGGPGARVCNPCPDFGGFSGCWGPFNKCIFRSGFGVFFCAGKFGVRACCAVCARCRAEFRGLCAGSREFLEG